MTYVERRPYYKARHLARWAQRFRGTPETFWANVNKTETCWLWTAWKHSAGYGQIDGRPAHRIAWELAYGPIPPGQFVLHRCDVKLCVNPSHLFLGTHKDNMADMRAKARQPRGAKRRNAKLTDDQVCEIRACWPVMASQHQLAREFGVSQQLVSKIVNRKAWRHP